MLKDNGLTAKMQGEADRAVAQSRVDAVVTPGRMVTFWSNQNSPHVALVTGVNAADDTVNLVAFPDGEFDVVAKRARGIPQSEGHAALTWSWPVRS